MCQLVKVSTDPRQPLHPVPIMSSVHTTTMTTTVTASPIAATVADVERYIAALDSALDCPFIQEDECFNDLYTLRDVLVASLLTAR